MATPPIVTAELTSNRLIWSVRSFQDIICDFEHQKHVNILVEQASEAGSSVNKLKARACADQADNVAESDEAGIVALGHDVILILTKQVVGSHDETRARGRATASC